MSLGKILQYICLVNILQIAIKLHFSYNLKFEKQLKSFTLSFSEQWLLSSGNIFLTSANALMVLLFRGGNVRTWFNVRKSKRRISWCFFVIVQFFRVVFRPVFFTCNFAFSVWYIVTSYNSNLFLSLNFLGNLQTFTLNCLS